MTWSNYMTIENSENKNPVLMNLQWNLDYWFDFSRFEKL